MASSLGKIGGVCVCVRQGQVCVGIGGDIPGGEV